MDLHRSPFWIVIARSTVGRSGTEISSELLGSSNKMTRDESNLTAFENRITTKRIAFGFSPQYAYGKEIGWTKHQCAYFAQMCTNMNISGAVFRIMISLDAFHPHWVTEVRTPNNWLTILKRKYYNMAFSLVIFGTRPNVTVLTSGQFSLSQPR